MHRFTKQDLLLAINQYQAAVLQATDWLQQKDFSNIVLALERSGFIDSEYNIKYTFHGYGCLVTIGNVSVDFDFGFGGRIDGFDLWFMYDFNKLEDIGISYSEITEIASELIQDETIIKSHILLEDGTAYSDGLYYLAEDWKNSNPPQFKLVCKQIEDLTDDPDISA